MTTIERIYSIVAQLIGASVFGFIIANVSTLLASFGPRNVNYNRKLDEIKEYLHARRLPKSLSVRIVRYFQYLYAKRSVFNEIDILSHLSSHQRVAVVLSHQDELMTNQLFHSPTSLTAMEDGAVIAELVLRLRPWKVPEGTDIGEPFDYGFDLFVLTRGALHARRDFSQRAFSRIGGIRVGGTDPHSRPSAPRIGSQRPLYLEEFSS